MKIILVNQVTKKLIRTNFKKLPRQNDLIWLNKTCFQVDKIVHSYASFPDANCKISCFEPVVFLNPIADAQAQQYNTDDINGWNEITNLKGFAE